jgi:predicted TIM-barrel fold metal-dependent hydrolase
MRVDIHTHIFPPEIVNAREKYFPSDEAFELLYSSSKSRLVTSESLLRAMDREEIDRAVVFGFPWKNCELSVRHNDYVLEAAAKHAPRVIPLACVYPEGEDNIFEAERCLRHGARGLGELAIYGECDQERVLVTLKEMAACCRSFHGVVLVHANEPIGHVYPGKAGLGLPFYYELACCCDSTPLILAHWGGGLCFYELLKRQIPEVLAHVYYDTAASPYLYRPEIYCQMVKTLGKKKIVFGSDYPLLPPSRYFREMEEARLTGEEIAAITGENAARLFRLEG